MAEEAHGIVRPAAPGAELVETRIAFMRYIGQGHEISVELPLRPLVADDAAVLQRTFDEAYAGLYGRTIPGLDVEVLSWTLTVATKLPLPEPVNETASAGAAPEPSVRRALFDPQGTEHVTVPVYRRDDLQPGIRISGPALIVEDQTTTVVTTAFDAAVNPLGYLLLTRR